MPLEYAAGAFPTVARAADGTTAFAAAQFLTITGVAWASVIPGFLADSPAPGACGVALGSPFLGGVAALVSMGVLNLTLGYLRAATSRRAVGARRAFAFAGCGSVLVAGAIMAALGFLIDALHLGQKLNGKSGLPVAAFSVAMLFVPAAAADVAMGFALARWGKGRLGTPGPATAPDEPGAGRDPQDDKTR